MRRVTGWVVLVAILLTGCAGMQTQDKAAVKAISCFAVMADIQEKIMWQTWNANGWAASPALVEAVLAQNKKGPIPGMDNAKWKSLPESDALVRARSAPCVGKTGGRRGTEK